MFDNYPIDDGLITAPTHKILEQSTLPKFFEINPDLKRYHHKSDDVIILPNRGHIYIRSTENPNVIEGMTLRWIWADEAGQMKLDAWVNFQGRLSIKQGSLMCTTTPYTLNWLYNDFYRQWKEGNKDYLVVQFKSCDNPYFPREEYERVKATMDGRTFRRRYDGLFEKMEGLVYEDFLPELHIVEPFTLDFKEIICGIDWGYTHKTAIVIIGITNNNEYYIIDEYYKSEKVTSEIIERLKYFQNKYKIRFWYPDPAEPDRLEEMRRSGLYPREVNKGKDSIIKGVDEVRTLMRENRFYIFSTCQYTIEEMSSYHYSDKPSLIPKHDELPVNEDDDLMAALRYAVHTYKPVVSYSEKRIPKYKPNNSYTGY